MAAVEPGVLFLFAETWRDRERVMASELREGDYLSLARRVVLAVNVSECGEHLRVVSTAGGVEFVNLWSRLTPVFRSPLPDRLL